MLPMDLGPIYRLGRVVMTPQARARVSDDDVATALIGHLHVACGEKSHPRRRRPAHPHLEGCRLLSACRAGDGTRFWVITEADRKLTRILLPEDF